VSSSIVDSRAIGSSTGRQSIVISARVLEELRRRQSDETPDYDSTIARLLWPPRFGTKAVITVPGPVVKQPQRVPTGPHGCSSTMMIAGKLRLCRASPEGRHIWWGRSHDPVTWE
jgi:hypothetical protein